MPFGRNNARPTMAFLPLSYCFYYEKLINRYSSPGIRCANSFAERPTRKLTRPPLAFLLRPLVLYVRLHITLLLFHPTLAGLNTLKLALDLRTLMGFEWSRSPFRSYESRPPCSICLYSRLIALLAHDLPSFLLKNLRQDFYATVNFFPW